MESTDTTTKQLMFSPIEIKPDLGIITMCKNTFLNTAEFLRSAMHKNRSLKVRITSGYYDLATPYFATDYTVNHMFLDENLSDNITQSYYEAGHMMYIKKTEMIKMKNEITAFYKAAY